MAAIEVEIFVRSTGPQEFRAVCEKEYGCAAGVADTLEKAVALVRHQIESKTLEGEITFAVWELTKLS